MSQKQKVGNRTIELSNQDKIYFPDDGITKGELVDYYRRIAEVMLPHIKDRPLTMQRFPDGIRDSGFYQKEAPDYFPDWIERVSIKLREAVESQPQIVCNDAATLVYLANQGCITPHIWLSKIDKLDYPDRLIFDLDPPGDDFEPVRFAARTLRDVLEKMDLVPFVMTTGSKGLHVVVPLDREADFDAVRTFGRALAEVLAKREPDRFTVETRKNKRQGRIFLDYLRNAYGQTGVSPYAVRPKPGAPVATPLDWAELGASDMHSQRYTLQNIFRRLGQKEDPWQEIDHSAQSLDSAQEQLEDLRNYTENNLKT